MNKKLLLLIPAILLAVSACGNNGQSSGTSSSSESSRPESKSSEPIISSSSVNSSSSTSVNPFDNPKKPHPWIDEEHAVTITWDNTFSYTTQIETMIADFNELEPNVTIVSNKISGSYDAILKKEINGIATGEYASLVTCYPDHVANYISYDVAVDFDQYIYGEYGFTQEEYDDFVPSFLEEGRSFYENGLYVMPQSKSIEPMYYNANILGKVIPGVNDGKAIDEKYINSLTWEELFDNFCPKFVEWNKTNKLIKLDPSEWGDNKFGGVIGYDSDDNLAITLCQQYGLPYTSIDMMTGYGSVDFNYDDNHEIFQKLRDAYLNGYLITKGTCNDKNTNYALTSQQCLFTVGSTGGLKYQLDSTKSFKTLLARLPQPAEGNEAMISQGPGMCVLSHGDEWEDLAAWAFIKFMTEPEETLYWASETGYAPVKLSCYTSDEYISMCDYTKKTAYSVDELKARVFCIYDEVNDLLFTSPAFKGSSTCRAQIGALVTKLLLASAGDYNEEYVKQAFKEAVDACKKDIA